MIAEKVLVQDPVSKKWDSKGVIKSICKTKRSYSVDINGSAYLRNRIFLIPDNSDGSDRKEINQAEESSQTI